MVRRAILFFAASAVLVAFAGRISHVEIWQRLDGRALLLVLLYTAMFVLSRYSPGRCLYRMLVLNDPERHLPLEVERACDFAAYAGTRILFAGLIFTLVDIARVLAANSDLVASAGALSMALSAALYAMILYVVVSRTGEAALQSIGGPAAV